MAAQLLLPAIKALASGGLKKAAMGAAKGAVKGKAKDFVTGKKRKGKGKGDALAKSEGGGEEQVEDGKGGTIVPITPMVGNYKVETLPDKPDEVGKPSKVSYETINNQLDSIIGLTNALKKTSAVKLKNDENRRKAERKASEKAKKRQRESLLERGAGKALGMAGNLYGKATQGFDPLKFFTMIFLGSLFNWITTNGSKIIGFLKVGLALFNNAGKLLKSGFKFLGKVLKSGFKLIAKLPKAIKGIAKGVGKSILGVGRKLGSVFGKIGKSLKNLIKGLLSKIPGFPKPPIPGGPKPGKPGGKPTGPKPGKPGGKPTGPKPGKPGGKPGPSGNAQVKPRAGNPRFKPPGVSNVQPPPTGSLAGGKPGSQLLKGGVGRSTNRMIAKVGGKNALRVIKNLKGGLSRIPIIGPLITLIVSVISGDPIEQTMFKTGGAVLGGFLGTFILPPPLGTLIGEILGEYIGDLFYVLTKGDEGGARAVGKKIQADILDPIVNAGTVAMDWVGNGFGRMYEGIPKLNVLGFGEIPNPLWMANPFNIVEKAGVVGKAFFTDKPMKKGEVEKNDKKENDSNDTPTPVSAETRQTLRTALPSGIDTNMSIGSQLKKNFGYKTGQEVKFQYGGAEYVARKTNQGWQFFDQKGLFGKYRMVDTKGKNQQMVAAFIKSVDKTSDTTGTTVKPERAGDFVMNSAGQLRVFDGRGYSGATPEQQKMHESGATNIDGTKPKISSGGEINFAKEMIKIHEGSNIVGGVHQAYRDSEGLPTIGYGHLIIPGDGYDMNSKISQLEADKLFDKDFQKHLAQAKAIPGYNKGNVQQKAALIDLTFNMGGSFYKDFPKFAAAVKSGDFQTAAVEIQDSDYYKQVGRRGPVIRDLLAGKGVSASYLKNIKVPTGDNLSTDNNEGAPMQSENVSTPSDGLESSETTPAATPAQVSPSTSSQTQMSNGITGISQQLSYEQSGNTVVMMQGSGGQQTPMSSGGGKGTPVMMGSGDVVNSYYKSQLMGFLYKQG